MSSTVDTLAAKANDRDEKIRNKRASKLERDFRNWLGKPFAEEIQLRVEDDKVVFVWGQDTYIINAKIDWISGPIWEIFHDGWSRYFHLSDQANLAQNLERGPMLWKQPEY